MWISKLFAIFTSLNKPGFMIVVLLMTAAYQVNAQNIYDLRKLTEQDWLSMTTEERLAALGTANKHAQNQTYLGNFGKYYDMYKRWGYDFYEMNDKYENYSFRNFENYNILNERRLRWSYNEFGDRISRMRHSGNIWSESYSGDGTFRVTRPGGYINSVVRGDVDGVWLARESTDDWAISAIGAGAIRAKFSPLTLSIPNIAGMRVDFQSANNTLSIVNSAPLESSYYWLDTNQMYARGGVLLRGGTFRRKFGMLTIGATYVNQYGVQGNRQDGDNWYGTVNNFAPVPLIVTIRVLDDSPEDNTGGPVVYDVRLRVNGKYRDDIRPRIILDDITRNKTTANIKATEVKYLRPPSEAGNAKPNHDTTSLNETIPKYADYFYYFDYQAGGNIKNVGKNFNINLANQYYQFIDPSTKQIHVNGTEEVVYWFDISSIKEHINRVEAELTVANDYRIQTSMIYTKDVAGGHDTQGKPVTWYTPSFWRTMAQAEGNVKDGSNLRTVSVDFGFQVATLIYGVDASFNMHGIEINGEFVTNSNHFMFPDGVSGTGEAEYVISGQAPRTGHKWAQLDNAYYITAKKDWNKFGFAGEIFKMGKFFTPWLDYATPKIMVGSYNSHNGFIRFPLIEDNDDDDMYPDTMFVSRPMGYRIISHEDPDGVFPGNDEDNDGIADNNKNNNEIADYDEDFLMFDVNPDEFVFGNDYNNNSIPDFREDDMKYDTPYDLDRKGYHFYVRYSPFRNVNLITGSFRTEGVGLSSRTNNDYFKFQVNYDIFDVGKLYAEYRYEEIQDNVRDQYMQVATKFRTDYLLPGITSSIGRFSREVYYDELEYKNSKVNRIFLDSKIRAIPSITIGNHIKFENNKQIEGVMYDYTYQPGETLNTFAMVNKIVYTKQFGNWVFSPGVKLRFYKKDRSDIARPGDYYTTRIPLLIAKYLVSARTSITLGIQGFSGFEFKHKDFVQSENDHYKKTYMFVIENQTTYFGYNIWASTGIKYDELDYEGLREFESYKSSTLYVNINLGW